MSKAFCPNGGTVTLSTSGSSSRVALPSFNPVCGAVRIAYRGNSGAHVKFGDSSVTATTNDMLLIPGTKEIFTIPPGSTHIAGVGSDVLNITVGEM